VDQLSLKELQMHVRIAGWLNIIANAIYLLLGACGFIFFIGMGLFAAADSGEGIAFGVLGLIGGIALVYFVVLALPGILAGYGLLKGTKWGQVLGIVVGILALLNFPIGTAIGAYTLFVLFQNSASEYFDGQQLEPA
jgi:hypothetical protein